MPTSRLDSRTASTRLGRERLIWRLRLGALAFAVVQSLVEPGDHVVLTWVILAGFWASVVVSGVLLRSGDEDLTRWAGATSMAVDTLVIGAILANNRTDPAEPVYLIVVLGMLEATMRWPRQGGALSAPLAAVAAGAWTVGVYHSAGLAIEVGFVTMRAGILGVLGFFLAFIVRQLSSQHALLQRVLDSSRDLIVALDEEGTVRSVNAASSTLLGYEPHELVGSDGRDLLHPDDRVSDRAASVLAAVSDEPLLIERRFRHRDGSFRWLELSIVRGVDDDGVHLTARDVTERRETSRRIAESEQRFRSLYEHNADAVFALDLAGRFTSVNPATERLTGYGAAELVGSKFERVIDRAHLARTVRRYRRAAAGETQNYDTLSVRRDGTRIDLDVTNMPIMVDGVVAGVFGVAKDVTDQRRLERELAHQATHDALTGLPNRVLLEQVLADAASEGRRDQTLLFLDLDRFKVVNDSLGHRSGDALLVEVVNRLAQHVRGDDLLVRWAGDEFCILLADKTSEASALAIADRMLDALAPPFHVDGRDVHISASIGVARGDAADDPERLVQLADHAMYDAKRAGRNRVSVHDAGAEAGGPTQIDMEMELRHAIDADQLVLHFQPIVELATGRIVAVESLVRWPMDDGTFRRPDSFIPLAEETGMIRSLTRFVLREACAQLQRWDDELGVSSDVRVWVNVSGADLQDPALVAEVVDALDRAGLTADRLVLEVTETMLLRDLEQVDLVVGGLQGIGVSLVIDDFGTGYSSMSQLHRLQVEACKIDRSFVSGAPSSARDAAIITSLCNLGNAFGFDVVGEGVETHEELEHLDEAGCRLLQGYLVARPCPAEELRDRMAAGRIDLGRACTVPQAPRVRARTTT